MSQITNNSKTGMFGKYFKDRKSKVNFHVLNQENRNIENMPPPAEDSAARLIAFDGKDLDSKKYKQASKR